MLSLLLLAASVAAPPADPSWIWIEGEGPPHWAPAEPRFFRRAFDVPAVPRRAVLLITADDEFEAFLNGARVGSGDSWQWVYRFDVGPLLRQGRNVLAVRVRSTLPGPGGLVLRLKGLPTDLVSDAEFRVTRDQPPDGWQQPDFDDSAWQQAFVLGPLGMPPWGGALGAQLGGATVIEQIVATYRPDDPVLAVPMPRGRLGSSRTVTLAQGDPPTVPLRLESVPDDAYALELLDHALTALGCSFATAAAAQPGLALALDPAAGLPAQGYRLSIAQPTGARLEASDPVGLAYGVATLIQLLRVREGRLEAPPADLRDFPTCEVRGPVTVPASADWLDFCAFFKMNTWFPGASGRERLAREAERRGIHLVLARHLPDEFDFQSDEQLDELVRWALDAAQQGFRWVTVNADDRPNEVFTDADRERFGPGYAGLGKAHAHFINRLKPRLEGKIELVFCPRVYYEVDADDHSPVAEDQRTYLANLSAGLREPLTCWITQVTPEFLHESAQRFRTLPLAWHNFFPGDTTDWKVYFEAYPVVTDPGSARGFCVLGNTREPELWRPNYVTFAANTWNPDDPIGLREAFTALYGVRAAAILTQYAVLAGGHDRPIGVMADFWQQPEEVAARFLASGWAGVLPKAQPSRELLDRCLSLSASAARAAELPLAEAGVPAAMAERLRVEARRTHLAFALWAHRLASALQVPGPDTPAETLRQELRDLLDNLDLGAGASDALLAQPPPP